MEGRNEVCSSFGKRGKRLVDSRGSGQPTKTSPLRMKDTTRNRVHRAACGPCVELCTSTMYSTTFTFVIFAFPRPWVKMELCGLGGPIQSIFGGSSGRHQLLGQSSGGLGWAGAGAGEQGLGRELGLVWPKRVYSLRTELCLRVTRNAMNGFYCMG